MAITNVTEYQAIAKQRLPKMIYDYYASAAEDDWTLQGEQGGLRQDLESMLTACAASTAGTIMVYKDNKAVKQLVRRAERAGFKAIARSPSIPHDLAAGKLISRTARRPYGSVFGATTIDLQGPVLEQSAAALLWKAAAPVVQAAASGSAGQSSSHDVSPASEGMVWSQPKSEGFCIFS